MILVDDNRTRVMAVSDIFVRSTLRHSAYSFRYKLRVIY